MIIPIVTAIKFIIIHNKNIFFVFLIPNVPKYKEII